MALIGQGKFGEPGAQYEEVIKANERVLGIEHPSTLSYATKFATVLSHQNKSAEAKAMATELEEHARQNSAKITRSPRNTPSFFKSIERKP